MIHKSWLALVGACCFALLACAPPDPQHASVRVSVGPAHGSGTHIGNRLILTAAHVVESPLPVQIHTHTGQTYAARILWVSKAFDVAMLAYDGPPMPAAQMACGKLRQGDAVTAFGNPGEVRFARFNGFISTAAGERAIWKVAHVLDVTGMPGMSGGGVFNMAGKLVGIFVGGYSSPFAPVSGITLMVPASEVCRMLGRAA